MIKINLYSLFFLILFFFIPSLVLGQEARHEVKSGETLFSISRQHNVTVQEIQRWNNLPDNQISIGQVLVIRPASTPQGIPEPTEPPIEPNLHRVDRGETLFSIARMHSISVQDIMTWNNLQSSAISVGQQLIISEKISEQQKEVFESDQAQAVDEIRKDIAAENELESLRPGSPVSHYIVKPGDTMFRIARQHNMTVAELMERNSLSGTSIEIGDRLWVRAFRTPPSIIQEGLSSTPQGAFITHKIKEDDNILDLLGHYRMDRFEFSDLNPDKHIEDLQTGDQVVLIAPSTSVVKNPYRIQARVTNVEETRVAKYAPDEISKTLTSGDLYNPAHLTAAHPVLPLGSVVFIENPENGKGMFVLINDRSTDNLVKLSEKAFSKLGFTGSGNALIYLNQR